jgi:hypothetical protein
MGTNRERGRPAHARHPPPPPQNIGHAILLNTLCYIILLSLPACAANAMQRDLCGICEIIYKYFYNTKVVLLHTLLCKFSAI